MVHEPGLDFSLMMFWAPAGLAEEAEPEEAKKVEAPAEDRPTASLGVDVLSQYIWRGFALSRSSRGDSAVIDRGL